MTDVVPPSSTLAPVTIMTEKPESGSLSAIQMKNRRKTVSIEEKLDVISRLGKGERIADICPSVGPAHVSIRTIRDNVDWINP